MKKLLAALLLLPSLAWATYIPVNGSTVSINNIVNPLPAGANNVGTVHGSSVTVQTPNNNTTALPVSATQTGTWNVGTVTTLTGITNALPTGTNNIGTVTGSTMSLQSAGVAITATSGALDMNIKSGSIANTGFNVNNTVTVNPHAVTNLNSVVISSFAATSSPMANIVMIGSNPVTTSGKVGEQLVSVEIAGSSNTVIASTFSVIGIDGTSRHVGYDAQASSVPVNVLNTVTITGSISNSGFNVNNTPAVTQSGAWTISNLNNVVISSFAATSTPQVNVALVSSNPVTTSSKVGEQLVSVEITGSSNTVIVSTMQLVGIDGVVRHIGYDAQASSMPVNLVTTIAKGTQGTIGVATQDLKDSGRTYVTLVATGVAGVTTEALFSFSQNKAGVTTNSVTSYTVASGKTLRIQGMYCANRSATTTIAWSRAVLRHNPTGATTAVSSIIYSQEGGGAAALAGSVGNFDSVFPDGIEITGNGTQSIGVSHLDQATGNVVTCTLVGYEY